MISLIFGIIIKHFLADVALQGAWINKGKRKKRGWLEPMAIHCLTHGFGTYFVVLFWLPTENTVTNMAQTFAIAVLCGLIDAVSHGIIDRIKIKILQWWKPESYNKYLIMNIIDQCCHFAVYGLIILSIYKII